MSRNTVGAIEDDDPNVSAESWERVAGALEVTVDELDVAQMHTGTTAGRLARAAWEFFDALREAEKAGGIPTLRDVAPELTPEQLEKLERARRAIESPDDGPEGKDGAPRERPKPRRGTAEG